MTMAHPPALSEVREAGSTYAVEGLTCGLCLAKLIEAVRPLPHVTGVMVDLVVGGPSYMTIEADHTVAVEAVLARVHDAGFQGRRTSGRRVRRLQRTLTRSAPRLHRVPAR